MQRNERGRVERISNERMPKHVVIVRMEEKIKKGRPQKNGTDKGEEGLRIKGIGN